MITIKQDLKLGDLNSTLIKNGDTILSLNSQAIKDDIDKYTERYNKCIKSGIVGSKHAKNIKSIIEYLKKLYKKAEKGTVSVSWGVHNNIVKSFPIEIKTVPEYKLYTTDYINVEEEKLVYVDYTEVADIIAFELMNRDLGETHESIEEKLKNIGIVAIYDSNELTKFFKDSPYKLSKIFKIGKSTYEVPGTNTIVDYFGNKKFDSDKYMGVVGYSCKCAMTLILEDTLHRCIDRNLKVKVVGISDTGIYYLTDHDDSYIKNILKNNVYVRTFGRKFEVVPDIQVF